MANKIKLELREEEIQNLIFSCNKSLAFLRAIRLDLGEKATKKIISITLIKKRLLNAKAQTGLQKKEDYKKKDNLGKLFNEDGSLNIILE